MTRFKASILLITYNQNIFVRDAALSCLSQNCEPIEIIFSDDCSTDGTYQTLCDISNKYKGPHTIVVRRNKTNLGIANHYNTLVKVASGSLLVTAAGDDVSDESRVRELLVAREAHPEADLIASYANRMTLDGNMTGQLLAVDDLTNWGTPQLWCKKRPYVIGATHAFTKRLWDKFGDIAADVPYEDQVMAFRASCLGGGHTVALPLVSYREGGVSSKHAVNSRGDRHIAIRSRYSKQLSTYSQIRRDMHTAELESLWQGKTERYLNRSIAALAMLDAFSEGRSVWRTAARHWQRSGIYWTIRQAWYTERP